MLINFAKRLDPECQSFIGPDLNSICLTARMVFLIVSFRINDFEKQNKKNISGQNFPGGK